MLTHGLITCDKIQEKWKMRTLNYILFCTLKTISQYLLINTAQQTLNSESVLIMWPQRWANTPDQLLSLMKGFASTVHNGNMVADEYHFLRNAPHMKFRGIFYFLK